MKNKRNEQMKQRAKREAVLRSKVHRNWNHELGIKVYHCYDEPRDLSYWDDVSFMWGSKYVCVCWTHPRYMYEDQCDSVAYDFASVGRPPMTPGSLFENSTKNYVKRGKSRKAIASYTIPSLDTPDAFYTIWREKRNALLPTSDLRQGTHFTVTQKDYCLMVSVCCPIEVRNEAELKILADFVRSVLDQKVSFNEVYGNYSYGSADYCAEHPSTI
jgi:hypothetical protein